MLGAIEVKLLAVHKMWLRFWEGGFEWEERREKESKKSEADGI